MSVTAEIDSIDEEDYLTSTPLSGLSFRIIPRVKVITEIQNAIVKAINLSIGPSQPPYEIKAQGELLDAVGAWEDYDDIDKFIEEIYKKRGKSFGRNVNL